MILRPVIFLVLAILAGFSLLGVLWEGSVFIKVVVGLTVAAFSVGLLIVARRFDRALKEKRGDADDAENGGISQ
ncbi:MAG: hypothetical protein BWY50_00979 [Spirochaetes bacterium ADurb.Bin315]|nr:hypothetical protein [Spirochaetota bacterium]NLL25376.1 hypothetical protein [Spirochaetales bacterium]OQA43365.1 MAG: hypothetical protein BWY50_00979 [Spirochaetes bacterium ADurb.Bin315]TAH57277.1 MAG: hypothetical protein EWM48_05650 [Sphaerochaeta sp.]HOE89088.1 hypothetical protein [Sphaerochaeta sp.]